MIWFETAGGSCLPVGLRLLLGTYLGTRLFSLGWCRSAPALPPCAVLALLPARSSTSTGKTTAARCGHGGLLPACEGAPASGVLLPLGNPFGAPISWNNLQIAVVQISQNCHTYRPIPATAWYPAATPYSKT